jgi:MSHA biogenesis protein MshM
MTITTLQRHGHAPTERDWLYNKHFNLNGAPFSLTPDIRFFYAHDSCRIALNTLMIAIHSGEGFTKITGEVGTGKTVLCRLLLSILRKNYTLAYIPNPYMEPLTLLSAIADEIGMAYPNNVTQHQLLKGLGLFIINSYAEYRRPIIICLDDAHCMPLETLEALRILSNIETQQRKLIQLVLFGQSELDQKLDLPECRQLKQRISFSCKLQPLKGKEILQYIEYRLQVAGYKDKRLFTAAAVRRLTRASGGILRLINILSHKAMMSAYGYGGHQVTDRHMKQAIADTDAVALPTKNHRLRIGWFKSRD